MQTTVLAAGPVLEVASFSLWVNRALSVPNKRFCSGHRRENPFQSLEPGPSH